MHADIGLHLGDSSAVRQGDRILTLGSPLGLEQTASEGIVSAVRDLGTDGNVLQITAPISPGNSGGPLLNLSGDVVVIASFRLKDGQSLNFYLAINELKAAIEKPFWILSTISVPEITAVPLPSNQLLKLSATTIRDLATDAQQPGMAFECLDAVAYKQPNSPFAWLEAGEAAYR